MPVRPTFVLRLLSFVPEAVCQILYGFLGELVASYLCGDML